jgi:hypothetical protein
VCALLRVYTRTLAVYLLLLDGGVVLDLGSFFGAYDANNISVFENVAFS